MLGHNWAALTSLAATQFDVHGKRADVYFECHYFDVATAVKVSDVSFGLSGQPQIGGEPANAELVGGEGGRPYGRNRESIAPRMQLIATDWRGNAARP